MTDQSLAKMQKQFHGGRTVFSANNTGTIIMYLQTIIYH